MTVRDLIKLLKKDGWHHVRTRGSHRQYHHQSKAGALTVAGKLSQDVPPGTLNAILKQGRAEVGGFMRYMVVVEKGPTSYGAHVPDLPGCVAVGKSRAEVLSLIREAIAFHIDGLKEQGLPIPEPTSTSEFVEIQAA